MENFRGSLPGGAGVGAKHVPEKARDQSLSQLCVGRWCQAHSRGGPLREEHTEVWSLRGLLGLSASWRFVRIGPCLAVLPTQGWARTPTAGSDAVGPPSSLRWWEGVCCRWSTSPLHPTSSE